MDASFSFANAERVRDRVIAASRACSARAVILDATTINDLDSTALVMLQDTQRILADDNVDLIVAGAHQNVIDILQSAGLWEEMGPEAFQLSPWRALVHVLKRDGREAELVPLEEE